MTPSHRTPDHPTWNRPPPQPRRSAVGCALVFAAFVAGMAVGIAAGKLLL